MNWRYLLPCLLALDLALGGVIDDGEGCVPPTGLQLSDKRYNSAKLRWNYDRYQSAVLHCVCVEAGLSVNQFCSPKGNGPSSCTKSYSGYEKSLGSLTVYTNYTACVQRLCGSNYSAPSCLSFTTAPLAPSAPFQVFVDQHSPSSLNVSWRYPTVANGPLNGYRVRWCLVRQCVHTDEHIDDPTVRSFLITGLQIYNEYRVYVSAYNTDRGKRLYSTESTVNEYTLPTYPSEPLATFTKVNPTQVNIEIGLPRHPNGVISGYEISWCPISRCYGDNLKKLELLQASPSRQPITGLTPWQNYTFDIKAFNTLPDNTRAYSPVLKKTMCTWPITPSNLPNLRATPLSSTAVKLTWELPLETDLPPSHFCVVACTVDDKYCFYINVESVREMTVNQLKPGTMYAFVVYPLISFGGRWVEGQASSVKASTFSAEPSRPSHLEEVQRQATMLRVSWTEPLEPQGPIAGYKVRLCPQRGICPPTGLVSRYRVLGRNSKNVTFYGLQPDTEYQVQVKAFNALADGSFLEGDIAVLDVRTKPSGPGEPVDLSIEATDSTSLRVSWQHPKEYNGTILGYRVTWWEVAANKSNHIIDGSRNESGVVTSTEYNITSLKPYTAYAVEVSAISNDEPEGLRAASAHVEGQTQPPPPQPPANLTAVKQIKDDSITLLVQWASPDMTTSPPIDGYSVALCQVRNTSDMMCVENTTSKDNFTRVFTNIRYFTKYVVKVRAYIIHYGVAVEGKAASVTVETEPPPLPLLKPRVSDVDCCSAMVSWDECSCSSEHEVYYSLSTSTDEKNTTVVMNTTSLRFASLDPWKQHQVSLKVCVRNELNRTACGPSGTTTFQTLQAAPSPPKDLRVTQSGRNYNLSWQPPAHPNGPLDGYVVSWYMPPERESPNYVSSFSNVLDNSRPLMIPSGMGPFLVKLSAFNKAEGGERLASLPADVMFVPRYGK